MYVCTLKEMQIPIWQTEVNCSCSNVYQQFSESWVDGARHEEQIVLLNETENENTVRETKCAISDLQNFILRHDAIPVFATIYPSSINEWNQHRLDQKKTEVLIHTENYESMQSKLVSMIYDINSFIMERNIDLKVSTPLTHKCLWHNRGP
jgi:hypothetical protein